MIDVEHPSDLFMQKNNPDELAASLITANNLTEQYRSKYIEIRNKISKDSILGLLYFAVAALPVIVSVINGEMMSFERYVLTVVPVVFGVRKINSIRRNIPGLLYNLDMYISMNETAQFLDRFQKPK